MRKVSVRMRLTIWYGGVLAVVLLAFGASVFFVMRHQLLERIDGGLAEEMADVVGEVQRATNQEDMLAWLNRRFGHHPGFDFQITAEDGQRVFSNARLGQRRLPIASSVAADRNGFTSERLDDRGNWRIVYRRVTGPEGPLVVLVARSQESYDHEMGELLAVLLTTGLVTLIAALSGGYLLARRALVPVERMTAAANRIGVRQLDLRLDVANPHDELGRLAQTINGMLDRLERSFREMQRFTADASHELRTPISIVRTEAEVALSKPIGESEKHELLGNILEECERLTWITDQLLTLSREDAGIGQCKREPLNLSAMAAEVADTMRTLAEAKRQKLVTHLDEAATVSGDAERLRHVVYNLLDNAIKYTPENGRVELAVQRNGSAVRLCVHDTGSGIPAEHLPHVFERFYRVDKARTRAAGGAGLGLSIVESIANAHGGRVEITSQAGKGTTCVVSLPIA